MQKILISQFILFVLLILVGCETKINEDNFRAGVSNHDLSLPQWGPYTKKYVGISHIPDTQQGLRFDLSVFPSFYNKSIKPPDVLQTSNFHPWEASPNLEYFSYRHELEWKDKVFTDIAYAEIDEGARAIEMTCVNNTDSIQNLTMHLMASLHFPPLAPHHPEVSLNYGIVHLPENGLWVDALDYESFTFKNPWIKDQLVPDGMMRAEVRENGLVNGSGIGNGFGGYSGDLVKYKFKVPKDIPDAILCIRYKTEGSKDVKLQLSGFQDIIIELPKSSVYSISQTFIDNLSSGEYEMNIETKSSTRLVIDGYAFVSKKEFDKIAIETIKWNSVPEILKGPSLNSVILKYENTDVFYGVHWDDLDFKIAQWFAKDLPENFNEKLNTSHKNSFHIDEGRTFYRCGHPAYRDRC